MKTIYSLLFLIAVQSNLNAQNRISINRPTITPVSSNASAMEKYVTYPVDHNIGIPNIDIPLYEIKIGDILLPISISYHSAGLKPKQQSGRVGTGWTLKAEPSIMRNILGTADDAIYPRHHSGIMNSLDRPSLPGSGIEQSREKARLIIDKVWDGESDRYVYNLATAGGTCFVGSPVSGPSINLISHPRNNDVITAYKSSKITSFAIKDPKGIVYKFGNTANSEEKSGDDVTRWMCDTISSLKTKAIIKFDYTSRKELNPALYYGMDNMLIIEDSVKNYISSTPETMLTLQTGSRNQYYRLLSNTQKESILSPNYYLPSSLYSGPNELSVSSLKTIIFGQNQVNFYYNDNGLSFITINDASGKIIRSIKFFISKYNSATELTKLDSIKVFATGCESKTYSFQYYNESVVPSISTRTLDHWGFANGRDYDKYLDGHVITVPSIKTKTYFHNSSVTTLAYHQINGVNREPDVTYTLAGVLRQITNPEGVQTQFSYSGNNAAFIMYYRGSEYEKYRHYLYPVGGLKVDRISTIDPKTYSHTYRDFKYGLKESETSGLADVIWGGGAIKHLVTDRDYCVQSIQILGDRYGSISKTSRIRTWSSMPISDITFSNGSSVMYNTVMETRGSLQDANIFKTAYHYKVDYHPHSDILLWDFYNSPNPKLLDLDYNYNTRQQQVVRKYIIRPYDPTDTFWDSDNKVGHLQKIEHYRGDTLASATNYHHDYKFETVGDTRGINVYRPYRLESFTPSSDDAYGETNKKKLDKYREEILGDTYWQTASAMWKPLIKETTTEYNFQNGIKSEISTSKAFEYATYNVNPATVSVQSSDKRLITNTYNYLNDSKDVLSYHNKTLGQHSQEFKIEFTEGVRPNKVKSKTNFATEFEDELIYHEYDSYGNIAWFTGRDGINTCYIWGYDNQHILAQIVNVTYPDLLAALQKDRTWLKDLGNLTEPTEIQLKILNDLRDVLKASQVTTYTYKPLCGVTSVCDPASRTTYYIHDYYGRLTESYRIENGQKIILIQHAYNFSGKDASSNSGNPASEFVGVEILNSLESSFIYRTGNNEHWVAAIHGGSGSYKAEWSIGIVTNGSYNITQTRTYTYSENTVTRSGANMIVPDIPSNATGRIYCRITDLVTGISQEDIGYFYASPGGLPHPEI